MKTKMLNGLLMACLVSLFLVGCGYSPVDQGSRTGSDRGGVSGRSGLDSSEQDRIDRKELVNVFYFDFDQAIVKRTGHADLRKHIRVLAGNRRMRIRLEGHADERGTREYNLALGERRAAAIRAYLVMKGVSRSQIEVVSYGEEKPTDPRHNEVAWAQNRRVEIIYP